MKLFGLRYKSHYDQITKGNSKKMDICTFVYSIRVMNNYTGSILAGEQALYLGLTRDLFSLINLHKGEGCLRYLKHINGALRVLVAFI